MSNDRVIKVSHVQPESEFNQFWIENIVNKVIANKLVEVEISPETIGSFLLDVDNLLLRREES